MPLFLLNASNTAPVFMMVSLESLLLVLIRVLFVCCMYNPYIDLDFTTCFRYWQGFVTKLSALWIAVRIRASMLLALHTAERPQLWNNMCMPCSQTLAWRESCWMRSLRLSRMRQWRLISTYVFFTIPHCCCILYLVKSELCTLKNP